MIPEYELFHAVPEAMTLYISGPMRGYPEYNFPAFMLEEQVLNGIGYQTINPARKDVEAGFDPTGLTGHEEWSVMEFDLRKALLWDVKQIIQYADGLIMLPHWEESKGAQAERWLAHALGIPVYEREGNRILEVFPDE